jgi:hypothetical protein
MFYNYTNERVVCHYLHPDSDWDRINYETRVKEFLPKRCTLGTPYFHIELKLQSFTKDVASMTVEECIDEDLVGQTLWFTVTSNEKWGYRLRYSGEEDDLTGMTVDLTMAAVARRGAPVREYQPRSAKCPFVVGDVVVLGGRASYDAPVPWAFASYVKGAYDHHGELRIVVYWVERGHDYNWYPESNQLGDGYSHECELIRHEKDGCDVIIVDNKLIRSKAEIEPESSGPWGYVENITYLINGDFYDTEAPGGKSIPSRVYREFDESA